jgi:tRNA A37 threonylcarbamoyladenosine dehydratase
VCSSQAFTFAAKLYLVDTSWLSRTELLIGTEAVLALTKKHVLVVGLGGVGSFAAEFIARAGVGQMTIVDGDVVDPSNRNRQLPALVSTHGVSKAAWMAQRLRDINPDINLHVYDHFLMPDQARKLMADIRFDYVVDAIDSLTPKLTIIEAALAAHIPIVSSMGAGGKIDPTQIRVADIGQTRVCRFAMYIRKRLKKLGITKGLLTVYSAEPIVRESLMLTDGANFKRSAYGTISYLPAAFGGACASVVIRDLLGLPIEKTRRPKAEQKR